MSTAEVDLTKVRRLVDLPPSRVYPLLLDYFADRKETTVRRSTASSYIEVEVGRQPANVLKIDITSKNRKTELAFDYNCKKRLAIILSWACLMLGLALAIPLSEDTVVAVMCLSIVAATSMIASAWHYGEKLRGQILHFLKGAEHVRQ